MGSEMCIRDRGEPPKRHHDHRDALRVQDDRGYEQPDQPSRVLSRDPTLVPEKREIQQDDHLHDEKHAGRDARDPRVRAHDAVRREEREDVAQRPRGEFEDPGAVMQVDVARV